MIAQYFASLEAATSLGIISLLISIALFAILVWRALRLSPASVQTLEKLPFDPDTDSTEHPGEVTS